MENIKKDCPKGYRWCPITKKCILDNDGKGKGRRMGKGDGTGPIGKPYNEAIKEAIELVDIILSEEPSVYQALKKSNKILDEIENQIDVVPDQDLDELQQDVVDELSKDSEEQEVEDEQDMADGEPDEIIENTLEENMKNAVKLLITENEYRTFFKSMLKKWKIKSPAELNAADKKKFFDEIDKGWKGKKESD